MQTTTNLVPPIQWLAMAGSTNTVTNANGLWLHTITNIEHHHADRGEEPIDRHPGHSGGNDACQRGEQQIVGSAARLQAVHKTAVEQRAQVRGEAETSCAMTEKNAKCSSPPATRSSGLITTCNIAMPMPITNSDVRATPKRG